MNTLAPVTVLFARADSIYKTMEGVDVWDAQRDALNWQGGTPVIAHPPCRAWGQLSHMATRVRPGEKDLALWAVEQVRRFGGVLEHPRQSKLWPTAGLPDPGQRDNAGGYTFPIAQHWFGHRAEKMTFLYIVGIHPFDLPAWPMALGEAPCVCGSPGRAKDKTRTTRRRPEITHAEREHTPPQLAQWLVELCRRMNHDSTRF